MKSILSNRTSPNEWIVISCFDFTGNMMVPWAEAGFQCYCVDLQHGPGERQEGNITYVGANMLDWLPPSKPCALAAFFPPCTHVAVSGRSWFKDKGLGALADSIKLFYQSIRLAEWLSAPYLIENPVSTVSTYWRKPDHMFDPCDYAGYQRGEDDLYTKKTCLWVGGGFIMPPPRREEPTQGSKMHSLPPSKDRANIRSATPKGFAQAINEWNCPFKKETEGM